MKKIEKQIVADAERWAAAEMAYGEGAGTRRKLLDAELQYKFNDPAYYDKFLEVYSNLDMNKYAALAIKERKALDRAAKAGQNFRALKNGNHQNLTQGVFIVVGVAVVLHNTGYDKVLEAEAKKLYKKAKTEIKFRRAKAKGLNVEKLTVVQ